MANKKTTKLKRLLSLVMSLLMVVTSVPVMSIVGLADELSGEQIATAPRYELNFNKGWKFNYGDVANAQSTAYSDKSWSDVSLPHDFSIIQDFTTSGTEGESGSLPGGTGWYRKSFILPQQVHDRVFVLNFGASYQETTVYVNGAKVGENFNGYNSFAFDISDYLYFDGVTQNVIAVKVVNNIPSSRWYSGSGLIGDVTLNVLRRVHIGRYGVQITTPDLASSNGTDGTTNINLEIHNVLNNAEPIDIVTDVLDSSGSVVASASKSLTVQPKTPTFVNLTAEVPSPALWSVDTPNMYKLRVRISENGEVVDEHYTDFGYTWSSWSQSTGFSLNGQKLKLKGVCMHLDQGGLGAAQEYDAFYRQIKILKEMGVNAIRGSHNVFPEAYIDVCNELGMLFMEEMFDGWYTSKNGNTYDFGPHFNVAIDSSNKIMGGSGMKWYQFVITQTIKRDRNNPSIFVWDVGNELDNYGDASVGSDIKNIIDGLDTRPILWGNNTGNKQTIDNYMDIFGGNYNLNTYLNNHSSYGMPFVGSETASALSSRGVYKYSYNDTANVSGDNYVHDANYAGGSAYQISAYDASKVGWGNTAADAWYYTIVNDWFSGEFIWTGFDYIGEPTPWNAYTGPNGPYAYPNSSYFGPIDTAGFYKDTAWLYNAFWNTDETTLHLVPGTWNSSNLVVDGSGYVDTAIYTNAPYVELLYNGNVIAKATGTTYRTAAGFTYTTYTETVVDSSLCKVGTLTDSNDHNLYPLFEVKYDSSATLTLKAYQSEGGAEITDTVGTKKVYSNRATGITVAAWNEDTTLTADGDSFNYIEVTAVDSNGNFANDYNGTINVTLTSNSGAGIIAAVDNGNAATAQKFQSSTALLSDTSAQIQMFNGKALIIVQSTENAGKINVTVAPTDLPYQSIGLTSVPETGAELTDEFEEVISQEVDVNNLDNAARKEFLEHSFEELEEPVTDVSYELYTLGSGAVTSIPSGYYVISGADATGNVSKGVLGTTSVSSGTIQTSGAAADVSSHMWSFALQDNGKYTISFTGEHVTNEFLNVTANGLEITGEPQELDVILSDGTVKIGDGTNFITYSSSSANTAGVSTNGTALKLYTVNGNEVKRFGNVGLVEDGTYIVYGYSYEKGSHVMSGTSVTYSNGAKRGIQQTTGTVTDNKIETAATNEWIFKYNPETRMYTMQNADKYLNIQQENTKVTLSDTPVELNISNGGNNKVLIHNGTYYLQDQDTNNYEMFSNWDGDGSNSWDKLSLYRKTTPTSAADIALYNAIEKALAENPAAYKDESFAALLDAVQDGIEKYGKDTVSDADKNAAVDAINAAFDALEKSDINPSLKDDIAGLQPPPENQEAGYIKYDAVSGTPIPDGKYILYNQGYIVKGTGTTATNTAGNTVYGLIRESKSYSGNEIKAAEINEITITRVSPTSNAYFLQNSEGQYLNIASSNNNVKFTNTQQQIFIEINSNNTVAFRNTSYYYIDHFRGEAFVFSSYSGSSTEANKSFTLFREQEEVNTTNRRALYDALQKGAATSSEFYTSATYNNLLLAMQNGYNVYVNDASTDAEIIAATQAIERAYDNLQYINLRPLLENQIANLTPPAGAQAQYGKYSATATSAIIPDGDYVISLDYDKRGTNGCWGIMTTTYVFEDGTFWDGMGWSATNAEPVVYPDGQTPTWHFERDANSGNYLISRINPDGDREYLYIPNAGNNDNCEMSATMSYSGKAAYWSIEIDETTGLVKIRNTSRTDHLITFCGQEAYDNNLIDGNLYVSAYQEGASSGGRDLRLQRVENGQLVDWCAPVADGKYMITWGSSTESDDSLTSVTYMTNNVPSDTTGALSYSSQVSISSAKKITAEVAHQVEFIHIEKNLYYIKNGQNYLNIDFDNQHVSNAQSLAYSSNPQALAVKGYADGRIAVYNPNVYNSEYYVFIDRYSTYFSTWGQKMSATDTTDYQRHLRLFSYEQMISDTTTQQQLYNKIHEAIVIDQGNYSDESYHNLLIAIKNGVDSYNNDSTDAQWQAAIDAIDAAINALEIAKTSFPATIYKYGYNSPTEYLDGGNDFNEIAYLEMFDKIINTPEIYDQVKAVIGYDTATWASDSERNAALEAVVMEYAKLYTIAFMGKSVSTVADNARLIPYLTFWNVWDKPNTKGQNEQINDGASVQGLFSTTLGEDGLPGSHAPYDDVLNYLNTSVTVHTNVSNRNVEGIHSNLTKNITRNNSTSTITLVPLENISVHVPDFFSRNVIESADKLDNPRSTYAKYYWDMQFPFVQYTNMFGVNTYVYDSSDTQRVFQASYNDANHTATAQLTEIPENSELGKVWGPNSWSNGRGFFPFNNRLDGSNASMTTAEAAIYHFGMSFSTEFYIPSTGQYGDGNDIVFEFSGDDDVLVYIDDVLVLDNGGLHGPRYSNINFTKKSVSYQFLSDVESGSVINPGSEGVTYTYGAENTGISTQNQAALEYLNKVATDGQQHTFTFYYLERGSTDSNCKLMFNIQKISDYVKLNDQSYVVDFGLPVEFDVKENNELSAPEGYELASYDYIGVTNRVPASANSLVMFTEPTDDEVTRFGNNAQMDFEGNFGTYFIQKDGNITYQPKTMQFSNAGSIYLCAKVEHDPTYKEGTVYYAFEKITIIPATTIYYEDDFEGDAITYTDGTVPDGQNNPDKYGVWQNVTNSLPTGVIKGEIYQHTDRPGATDSNAYGYDEAYDECAMYSGYSAKYVTVSAKNNPNATYSGGAGASWPEAEFTFAGTGFDLISVTSKDTGTMNLTVIDENGKTVKNHTVNTYYGYTYGQIYRAANGSETLTVTDKPLYLTDNRGYTDTPTYYAENGSIVTENTTGNLEPAYAFGWITENIPEEDNALYQIPVIKVTDLDYGTYTVKITPMYSSRMDVAKDGAYDFYVDAVRIYNPAGIGDSLTNSTISYAYTQDREANPDYLELRNMLIATNKLTNDGTSAEGVVFIDGISDNDDVSKYTSGGPNNELYLLKGQAVAFQIWASSVPDDIQISAKAVGVEDPTMFVSYTTTSDLYTAEALIRTATDLSYSVDSLLRQQSEGQLGWTPVTGSDGNTYYSSGTIVIQNISDGIISITNIKWTFPSAGFGYYENLENTAPAEEPVMLMSNYSTFRMARSAVRAVNADLEIGEEDVTVENNNVTAGESIKVNVSTSTDVDTLIIRDENGNVITPEIIESYVETIDNKEVKQWTVTLTEDESGTYTYTITGAYENGYESGIPVEITVTVEDVPQKEETPEEEADKELTFFEKLIGFFNRLIDFFSKLVNMLTGKQVL
ncbi:MAG: hypothetical protein IKW03_09415 [Clostridia bacterium]|nr:hypothetical protein [Clostridia bacterium]